MANLLSNFADRIGQILTSALEKGKPAAALGTIKTYTNGAQYKKVFDGWEYIGMATKKNKTKNEEKHAESKGKSVEHGGTHLAEGQVLHHHFLGQVKITALHEQDGQTQVSFTTKDGESETQSIGGFMKSVALQKKVYKTKKDGEAVGTPEKDAEPATEPKAGEKEPSPAAAPADPEADATPIPHGALLEAEHAYAGAKDLHELMTINGKLAGKHKNAPPEVKAAINELYKPVFEKLWAADKAEKQVAADKQAAADKQQQDKQQAEQEKAQQEQEKATVAELTGKLDGAKTDAENDAVMDGKEFAAAYSALSDPAQTQVFDHYLANAKAFAGKQEAENQAFKAAHAGIDNASSADHVDAAVGALNAANPQDMAKYNAVFAKGDSKKKALAQEQAQATVAKTKQTLQSVLDSATDGTALMEQFKALSPEFDALPFADKFALQQQFGDKINTLLDQENAQAGKAEFKITDPSAPGYTAQFQPNHPMANGEILPPLWVTGKPDAQYQFPASISPTGTKKNYYVNMADGQHVTTPGEALTIPGLPFEFFTHKNSYGEWNVSEAQSGMACLSFGTSKENVTIQFQEMMAAKSADKELAPLIAKVQIGMMQSGSVPAPELPAAKAPKPAAPAPAKKGKETHHTFTAAHGESLTGEILKHQPGSNSKLVGVEEGYNYSTGKPYHSIYDSHTGAKLANQEASAVKAVNFLKKQGTYGYFGSPAEFDQYAQDKAKNQYSHATKYGGKEPFEHGAASMAPKGPESTALGSLNNPKIKAVADAHGISNHHEAHSAYHALVNHASNPAAFHSALHTAVTSPTSATGKLLHHHFGINAAQVAQNLNADPAKHNNKLTDFFKMVMGKGMAKLGKTKHLHD